MDEIGNTKCIKLFVIIRYLNVDMIMCNKTLRDRAMFHTFEREKCVSP